MDVVVLGRRSQSEERFVCDLASPRRVRAVPANVRYALVGVVELAQFQRNDTEAFDFRVLFRSFKQRLHSNAYPHKRLSSLDVFADGLDVAGFLELAQAVAEVTNTGDDEFLGRHLHQRVSIGDMRSSKGSRTSAAGTSAGDFTHSTV